MKLISFNGILSVLCFVPLVIGMVFPGGHLPLLYLGILGLFSVITLLHPVNGLAAFVFLQMGYTIIRCGNAYNVVYSGFRTELIILLIVSSLLHAFVLNKGNTSPDRLESQGNVNLYIYALFAIVVMISLLRFGVSFQFLMSLREKGLILLLVPITYHIYQNTQNRSFLPIYGFFAGATMLAFFSLLNYYGTIQTPFIPYVLTHGSEEPVFREIFGFYTIRMNPLATSPPGTTAMVFSLAGCIWALNIFFRSPDTKWYLMSSPFLILLVWASVMTLSFSVFIPFLSLALLLIIVPGKFKFTYKLFGLGLALVLIFAFDATSLTGMGYHSVLTYSNYILGNLKEQIFSLSITDIFIGKGIDVRSAGLALYGQEIADQKTTSWDVGIVGILFELGLIAFIISLFPIIILPLHVNKRKWLLRDSNIFSCILIFSSSLFIVHGSPYFTRPIDVLFLYSIGVLTAVIPTVKRGIKTVPLNRS